MNRFRYEPVLTEVPSPQTGLPMPSYVVYDSTQGFGRNLRAMAYATSREVAESICNALEESHKEREIKGPFSVESRSWDCTDYQVIVDDNGKPVAEDIIEFSAYAEGAFIEVQDSPMTMQMVCDMLNAANEMQDEIADEIIDKMLWEDLMDSRDDWHHYDIESMKIDYEMGNIHIDDDRDIESYRHENIVGASLLNGQFKQARRHCERYGLDYAAECKRYEL